MAEYQAKSLSNGQLPSSKTTLYTVPPGRTLILHSACLVNTNVGAEVSVNLYVNLTGTSRRILPVSMRLARGSMVDQRFSIVLEPGDLIEGDASAATTVDYVLSGMES